MHGNNHAANVYEIPSVQHVYLFPFTLLIQSLITYWVSFTIKPCSFYLCFQGILCKIDSAVK